MSLRLWAAHLQLLVDVGADLLLADDVCVGNLKKKKKQEGEMLDLIIYYFLKFQLMADCFGFTAGVQKKCL